MLEVATAASGPSMVESLESESRRRALAARLAALCLAGLGRPRPAGAPERGEALLASGAWLSLIDEGRYPSSWTAAAPPLRSILDEEDWASALRTVRTPLGRCLSRRVTSSASLAAPESGEAFVVTRFDSRFERASGVEEIVATVWCHDGRWRVAGYFVHDTPLQKAWSVD